MYLYAWGYEFGSYRLGLKTVLCYHRSVCVTVIETIQTKQIHETRLIIPLNRLRFSISFQITAIKMLYSERYSL